MLYTGNKPKSRKSSEKENDRKSVNFAAVEGGNIFMFGVAPWKMETVKAMAILGTYKDMGEQRFTLRPEDMSRLVATSTGQFDPRLLTPIYICTNVGAPVFMMYK